MKRFFVLLPALAITTMTGCKDNPGAGEPGAKLIEARCLRCHPTGISKAHKTREGWDQTLSRMMAKGAALKPEEKAMLVDFLLKYY